MQQQVFHLFELFDFNAVEVRESLTMRHCTMVTYMAIQIELFARLLDFQGSRDICEIQKGQTSVVQHKKSKLT
jgi:hypothetical protein